MPPTRAQKEDKGLQARLLAEIEQLVSSSGSTCADCSAGLRARAAFCSITLGTFLCNRCYGIHRAIGTHVTRTKCVGLDAFSPSEVAFLRAHGNARAEATYAARAPQGARPGPASSNVEVERWIRDKYELRKYWGGPRESDGGDHASGEEENAAHSGWGVPSTPSRPPIPDLISFD